MKTNIADIHFATAFICENFTPEDRLAIVVVNNSPRSVIQRIAKASTIAQNNFQNWLQSKNADRAEIYISMNALKDSAAGRTKADIATVRHLFLDLDNGGTAALHSILKRKDLPKPSFLVSSSPGKWQILWRVAGFTPAESESLQRCLAREVGADLAATDCSRVLRLPGFYNHKYTVPHLVTAEKLSAAVYGPEHFPIPTSAETYSGPTRPIGKRAAQKPLSQSERDWAFAMRALDRGDSPESVIAAIATYRRFDKHNPKSYANRTVYKAAQFITRRKSCTSRYDSEK
jgi:hypothetical protein